MKKMKSRILIALMLIVCSASIFVSCSNDDNVVETSKATISVQVPEDLTNAKLENVEATLTNVQTGSQTMASNFVENGKQYTSEVSVPVGVYNVSFTAKVNYELAGKALSTNIRASQNNVSIANGSAQNVVNLLPEVFYASNNDFVISEIFFAPLLTQEGKTYNRAQYIVITNNTNNTLYADSLLIITSADISNSKRDYTPDFRKDGILADNVYMIPGTGRDVAVEAGKSIVVATNGKNHALLAKNGPDLSKANFEIFEQSTNSMVDEDNANVANVDVWFKSSLSFTVFNQRGVQAFALARATVSKDNFIENYQYTANYKFTFGDVSRDMTQRGYLVPNSWVLDAVCLGIHTQYDWSVISDKLDAGFTYCMEDSKDKNYYGTSVIRKMENGKYVDTNNSTNDFMPRQSASLLTK